MSPAEVRNIHDTKSLFQNVYVSAPKDSDYFYHHHSYTWLHWLFLWGFFLANKHLFQYWPKNNTFSLLTHLSVTI